MTKRAGEDYLKLIEFVVAHKAGDILLFSVVEGELGIVMDHKGRSKLRQAIEHENLEALAIPNHGYELLSAKTVRPLADGRMNRMEHTAKRTVKALGRAAEQFISELDESEKHNLLMESAIAGAIRGQLETDRKQRARKPPPKHMANGDVPDGL